MIIGVHSPKFEHEKSDRAVAAATERYGVAHPVFNDPELQLWQQYAVRAWPTLVLIDPDGYLVAQAAGEGQTSGLRLLIDQLIDRHRDSLRRGDHPYRPPVPQPAALRFPAKAVRTAGRPAGRRRRASPAGADRAGRRHGAAPDRQRRAGPADGPVASFAEPNGLALVPAELGLDFDVLVADTGNHLLRGVRLADGDGPADGRPGRGLAGTRTVTGPVPDGAVALGRGLVAGDRAVRDRGGRRAPAARLGSAHRPGVASWPAPPSKDCGTGRPPTAGWRNRPGWRWTATGCGSSTPRPRRCAT